MSLGESRQVRAYRALVLLYPRSFRDEYRDLMVQAFQDDLIERGTRRVWSRTIGDLLVSIPIQLVETAMPKPSKTRTAQIALLASTLTVLAVAAAGRYVALIGAVILAVTVSGLVYWRSTVPYRDAVTDASAAWWRVILAGAVLLGGIGAAATFGPDMDWFPWHLAAFLYLSAWVAMISGVLLGLLHLAQRLRERPISA